MRLTSICALLGAAATLAPITNAQTTPCPGASVVQPPFNNTFSSSLTRGYFFQAPVSMTIDSLEVPDEPAAGEQSVELYLDNMPPPAFNSLSNPPLVFSAYTQPAGTPIPTGGVAVGAGQWVIVLGATNAPNSTTMNNSYAPAGTFSTTIGGIPVDIARCGTQASIVASPGPNPIWSEVNGSPSRVEMCVTITGVVPPTLVGVAELIPFQDPLGLGGGIFRDNDFLRWNYDDTNSNGANTGIFAVTSIVFGFGGPPPTATSAQIPGLIQPWPGSTPAGPQPIFSGPNIVGANDLLFPIPPGFFSSGDTMRMQSLYLDLNVPAGLLPASVMFNTLLFTHTDCGFAEAFDTLPTGIGLPAGWSQSGTLNWRVHTGGTSSSATGPTSAFSPSNYLYAETSSPATAGSTYIFDTAPIPSASAPGNQLNFQLSRIGATIGTLNVLMDDGTGTFIQVATYTGADPGQAQNAIEWGLETVDLTVGGTVTVPANIVLRFEYTYGGSFTGDIAIDDICLN